jgi:hypothetical protein
VLAFSLPQQILRHRKWLRADFASGLRQAGEINDGLAQEKS